MNPPSVNTTDSPAEQSTEHSTHAHTNRLIEETSPYLLQHAHNPVNWYPWGAEALALAKKEGKPIFLSIGYSACHWCHVMERESFEDEATAKILNQSFIAIKVDREERPDIDEIYMTAVQMMTGRGGWPLSVWLTPDLEPFFGGTYFPPQDRLGMPGFKSLLLRVVEVWNKRPDDIHANADQIVRALRDAAAAGPDSANSGPLQVSLLSSAVGQLGRRFDPVWGGFGPAPKFPPSGAISLLLRQHPYSDDSRLMEMATVTLDRMAFGGMYDQLGGGFHRYSVDAQWLVPHFEKMLYDNAILAEVYLDAWQATHKDLYARVATETLDYILRDMADPAGGFHSAEDADSQGEEGRFYIWTLDQIKDVLGDDDGTFLARYYGVTEDGAFEGRNILHVPKDSADWAAKNGLSEKQLVERLKPLRRRLLAERDKRVRPGKDDKVLTAWNAMAISALARGYQVLGDERYRQAADRAADFILQEMVRDDGVLLHTYRGAADGPGTAKLPGYLDDYAEMANALVDLYETTFEPRRLDEADRLVERMLVDFWDDQQDGFFFTSSRHKNLLVRTRSFQDGAVPSGNSVAALAMLRLAKLLDKPQYHQKAGAILTSMRDLMVSQPQALLNTLIAADFYLRPTKEIAIAGSLDDDRTRQLLAVVHYLYLPNKILALVDDSDASHERIPLLRGKTPISGRPAAYVCENYTCKMPVTQPEHLERLLDEGP